jgi:hypothetical protein
MGMVSCIVLELSPLWSGRIESVVESECVGEVLERVEGVSREKEREWRKGMEIANLEQKKKARYRRPDQDTVI